MSTVSMNWKPGMVFSATELEANPQAIASIKAALSPAQTVALTALREADARFEDGRWVSNPVDAAVDIIAVITNRTNDKRWRDQGFTAVCLQRWAFSCWELKGGPDDPRDADTLAENFELVMHQAQKLLAGVTPPGKLLQCLAAAEAAVSGLLIIDEDLDRVCHYHANWIQPPKWSTHPKATVACRRWGHVFYRGVP